jgi:ABC-type polysaccharide/polyol phosphate transport system ATPase subunit
VLRAENLGKKFKIYPAPWGRAAEWLSLGRARRHEDFWALRGVTFALARGESLGVIGVNGSGKSTLLKLLSGALHPTEGAFEARGRVLSLLELGTGVNPQLTGRQNVVTSSRLLDFPAGYAEERMPQIEAFADLPPGFFDRPVGLYSSGMLVRLVFSMFACFDPDVFIVDEALSVGDVFFQQKCARRLQEMRAGGTTMLFVSHDLAAVEALCDRVMVLHGGTVRHDGDKKAGIALYYAFGGGGGGGGGRESPAASPRDDAASGADGGGEAVDGRPGERRVREVPEPPEPVPEFPPLSAAGTEALPWQSPDARDGFGTGAVEIDGVCFRRPGGSAEPVVEQGGWLEVFVRARAVDAAAACNLGLAIHDRHNQLLFARGWLNAGLAPLDLPAGARVVGRFALKLDLEPGEYILSLAASGAIADPASPTGWNQHVGGDRYGALPHAAKLAVVPAPGRPRASFGPANLQSRVDGVVSAPADVAAVRTG